MASTCVDIRISKRKKRLKRFEASSMSLAGKEKILVESNGKAAVVEQLSGKAKGQIFHLPDAEFFFFLVGQI